MDFGKTSIVILTYNKLEYTKQCINSIRKFTASGSYEIVIVDNHSVDETVEWLKAQEDIRTIINNENLGFPKGCNQGIQVAQGDSILLLNNDVIVTPNWLENLKKCLYSAIDIGAVGTVTNYYANQGASIRYTSIDEMIAAAEIFNISNPELWEERLGLVNILEYLTEHWTVLKSMGKYLKPDGKILACIPNFLHFSILRNLLKGNLSYGDTGTIDRSHLRFFTLNEINRLFNDAGYKDLHYMGMIEGKKKEDEDFTQAVSVISDQELVKQFDIHQYLVTASPNPYIPEGKKTFVTLFPETENFHLTKDVGMIAFIMFKYFDYNSIMVCYKNGEYTYLSNEVKGLKIDFIEKLTGDSEEDAKKYLVKNAAKIDILHLFHLCKRSINLIAVYKALNPKGKVYLKLDASVYDKRITLSEPIINILRLCDLISIETKHILRHSFSMGCYRQSKVW